MIRVAWICHFSDPLVRRELSERESATERFLVRRILRRESFSEGQDTCLWNSRGIAEFSRFPEVELHVVMPYKTLTGGLREFTVQGIHYHCFPDQGSYFKNRLLKIFRPRKYRSCSGNVRKAARILSAVRPDIVHLIGAESRDVSVCVDSVPEGTPLVVQLQTLLSKPGFRDGYYLSDADYELLSSIEKHALERADFIGTTLPEYRKWIQSAICPQARFVDTKLAVGVDVDDSSAGPKDFDFVYFALHIEKSADLALEAFALAHNEIPSLTLDVIGNSSADFRSALEKRAGELGVSDAIVFEGALPTHERVISRIRQARFALLPLKVDFISGTIREAMANGLPVVTTVTEGTPTLNSGRESVLLSPVGDHKAMAANMLRLVREDGLAERLRSNALKTVEERYSNRSAMLNWLETYKKILEEWRSR